MLVNEVFRNWVGHSIVDMEPSTGHSTEPEKMNLEPWTEDESEARDVEAMIDKVTWWRHLI